LKLRQKPQNFSASTISIVSGLTAI